MLDEHEQLAVIGGLREGNRDAWGRLYDGYSVDIWRYVSRLLAPDAAAIGDVVQEAFIEAARSAKQFDSSRGTLWNWLVGIAHHRVTAHWRQAARQSRLQRMIESGNVSARHLLDGESAANAITNASDIADFVRSVLTELSSDYAALLTAKYLDGNSLAELSTQFGSSVDAIKSKLARARQEFRAKFVFMAKSADAPSRRPATGQRSISEKQL